MLLKLCGFVAWISLKYKKPSCARIAGRTGCQWPWRLSNVSDFYFIGKGICNFLLLINTNFGPISHCLATIHP